MKQKLVVLLLVGVIALLSVGPALAQPAVQSSTKFLIEGRITAIGENSFTVHVWDGHGAARRLIGQDVELQVVDGTIYRDCTEGCVPITFADLQVGDILDPVKGMFRNGTFTALVVRIDNDI